MQRTQRSFYQTQTRNEPPGSPGQRPPTTSMRRSSWSGASAPSGKTLIQRHCIPLASIKAATRHLYNCFTNMGDVDAFLYELKSIPPCELDYFLSEVRKGCDLLLAREEHSPKERAFLNEVMEVLKKGICDINKEETKLYKFWQEAGFPDIGKESLWKLFIDTKDQSRYGKFVYENEPGYLAGCYRGFLKAIQAGASKKKINCQLLCDIHDEAIKGAFKLDLFNSFMLPKEFRDLPLHSYAQKAGLAQNTTIPFENMGSLSRRFALYIKEKPIIKASILKLASRSSLRVPYYENSGALFETYVNESVGYAFQLMAKVDTGELTNVIFQGHWSETHTVQQSIDVQLSQCYSILDANVPLLEKETAIAACVANLDRIHPFHDGNIRTLAMILANSLRAYIGLIPVIWDNPNDIDALLNKDIVECMHQGQQRVIELARPRPETAVTVHKTWMCINS